MPSAFFCHPVPNTKSLDWSLGLSLFCRNLKCGSIFCGGGGESITGKRAAYTVYGIECKLAVDDDKTRNIDKVPKGTRCGPNKVKLSVQRHITQSFVNRVGCFAQNQTSVFRFASTTDVWIYPCTGQRRTVRRNATTMGWESYFKNWNHL